jgi:hypothetical protein
MSVNPCLTTKRAFQVTASRVDEVDGLPCMFPESGWVGKKEDVNSLPSRCVRLLALHTVAASKGRRPGRSGRNLQMAM